MGKMKKLAALAAAGILCMSMGFSVMAAPSVTDPEPEQKADVLVGDAVDKDGNYYDVNIKDLSDEVKDVLNDMEVVTEIFKEAGYKTSNDIELVYLGVGDITIDGEMPEGGVDIEFTISKDELKPGDTVYVMHQKSDGTWEILEGIVGADNAATIHFDSLSPVAVVKFMSDGSAVVLDKEDQKIGEIDTDKGEFTATEKKETKELAASKADAAKKNVSEKKSPKTGE